MRCLLIFVSILTFSCFCFSQTAPLPSDFQSWNETQLILPLVQTKDQKGKTVDKATVTLSSVLRIGRKNLDFLDQRISGTFDFRVNKFLSLQTGVLYRKDEIVKNVFRYETRYSMAAVLSKTWKNFTFRDRNMFEHRSRKNRSDANLYRHRIQISYPINYKKKELFSPFISEEGYYDLGEKIWSQNEFYAGITRRINRKTSIDIAYVRVDFRPRNVNGLSLNLRIKLR